MRRVEEREEKKERPELCFDYSTEEMAFGNMKKVHKRDKEKY